MSICRTRQFQTRNVSSRLLTPSCTSRPTMSDTTATRRVDGQNNDHHRLGCVAHAQVEGDFPTSSRSKQLQMSDRGHRGTGSHRVRRPVRPLVVAAIGGAGVVLGAPVAALLIGSGVAQAAPLVSAPTDVCTSLVGCNDPSASSVSSTGGSLFGGSAALALIPAGPGVGDPFGLANAFLDL